MSIIQQIKAGITLKEYAINHLSLHLINDRCVSVLGGSNYTECVFYDNFFYDFKHNIGGDVIDLCALARHNGDRGQAIKDLSIYLGVYDNNNEKWQKYTANLCNYIQKCHEELTNEQKKYIRTRNITDETINALKLGNENGRIVIPYYKNGYVSYYITRGDEPKYKKAKLNGLNENTIWGLHTLHRNKESIFICEGAFDAISFDQEKQCVISTMGGKFNKDQTAQAIDVCRLYEGVFLCFDNDTAGNKFLLDMAEIFIKYHIHFKCIIPDQVKDISKYYEINGIGSLVNLVLKAVDGLIFLAKNFKKDDEAGISNFCKRIAMFTPKLKMIMFFEHLKSQEKFSLPFLKELQKQCTTSPSEDFVVKLMMKKYILLYNEGFGIYEYKGGKWTLLDDVKVQQYIAMELGKHRTGGRITSILRLLKSAIYSKDTFNMQPIFNFKNGILDLDTGKILEHSPSFLSTFQVKYNYIEDSYSEKWIDFLMGITNDNIKKIELLQEISGYILFNDNSLQKAFFLVGEGANGKSVFLNVLEAIFAQEVVTNIQMSGLTEHFQRIFLATSLLNISTEAHSNFKNAETYFKQAVVGDKINGCLKRKDFVSFTPRTKFFTACNEFIKTKDTTDGFLRRILFVKFNIRFTDTPKAKFERKADKMLERKLKRELPGIFNWMYDGYKKLKKKMEFTVLVEQDEIMAEFMKYSDPVFAFLAEEIVGKNYTFIRRDSLYEEYKNWCIKCSHFPQGKNKFLQSIRNIAYIHMLKMELKEKQSHGDRGFEIRDIA